MCFLCQLGQAPVIHQKANLGVALGYFVILSEAQLTVSILHNVGGPDLITLKDLRTELRLFSTEKFPLRACVLQFQPALSDSPHCKLWTRFAGSCDQVSQFLNTHPLLAFLSLNPGLKTVFPADCPPLKVFPKSLVVGRKFLGTQRPMPSPRQTYFTEIFSTL